MYQVLTRMRTFCAFCEDLNIFVKLTFFTFKLRVKIIRILLQLIKNGRKNSPFFCRHKVKWLCDQRHDATVIKKTVFKKSWKKTLIGTKKTPRKPRFALKVMRKPRVHLDLLYFWISYANFRYRLINGLLKSCLLFNKKLSILLKEMKWYAYANFSFTEFIKIYKF